MDIFDIETIRDRIRGSLIAGAAGDALGYTVEFMWEDKIFERYGCTGITEYECRGGLARVSDDTQMTLFTAEGILKGKACGDSRPLWAYVEDAYHDWLFTQRHRFGEAGEHSSDSRLLRVPELYASRAPGNTCLSALYAGRDGRDPLLCALNQSKGCGGIMRAAPAGLGLVPGKDFEGDRAEVERFGAQIAAVTHGHSLGYMPAAVLAHIVSRILTDYPVMSLREIVKEARDTVIKVFAGDEYLDDLTEIMDLAMELSGNDSADLENIHALGEGWVGEETLGIALYAALKYENDISRALIVSVNHNGDSDSTGAVTGNILGTAWGYSAIPEKWKDKLEMRELILETADALAEGYR